MTDEGNRKRAENLRIFSQAATIYDRIGPEIFSHLVGGSDVADIAASAKVLDVAAGRGALLFPAAAKVGPTGHVTAIDFSPDMVARPLKILRARRYITLKSVTWMRSK